jgi:hypothetical protein
MLTLRTSQGTNTLLGLYNAPFETTRQKINDRRTRTLLKLGESVSLAHSVSNFWVLVLKALQDNEFDFPFALLYSLLEDTETASDGASISSESSQSMKSCILEGSLGKLSAQPHFSAIFVGLNESNNVLRCT